MPPMPSGQRGWGTTAHGEAPPGAASTESATRRAPGAPMMGPAGGSAMRISPDGPRQRPPAHPTPPGAATDAEGLPARSGPSAAAPASPGNSGGPRSGTGRKWSGAPGAATGAPAQRAAPVPG